MISIERRVRAMINPVSTALTGWWCHSAVRFALTGHGPTRRRLVRKASQGAEDRTRQMRARARAIDELMAAGLDDESGGGS